MYSWFRRSASVKRSRADRNSSRESSMKQHSQRTIRRVQKQTVESELKKFKLRASLDLENMLKNVDKFEKSGVLHHKHT